MALSDHFNQRRTKTQWLHLLDSDRMHFHEAIDLAIMAQGEKGWRSAWLLYHRMHQNDQRLQPHLTALIRAVPGKRDGHQRELLKIIGKMKCDEAQEGELFDTCLRIWEDVKKQPSVRMVAFRTMAEIAWRHPELNAELLAFATPEYAGQLSPGIRMSFEKLCVKLRRRTAAQNR